jgi:carbon-monoxide dehydrogenase large subunit
MTAVDDRPTTEPEIGRSRRRKEDQRLITGRTRWTDNIVLPGMLHMAFVRSPYAHATITSVDTAAAKASPNVVAVLTGTDLDAEQGSLPNAWTIAEGQVAPRHPAIAVDHVAFAGEAVAVVVARTAREARDAADLVDVEYDELTPVLDMEAAVAEGADLAHPTSGPIRARPSCTTRRTPAPARTSSTRSPPHVRTASSSNGAFVSSDSSRVHGAALDGRRPHG